MINGTERYIETVKYLAKLYDYCNVKLFGGELTRPVITVQRDERNKTNGWFSLQKVWKWQDKVPANCATCDLSLDGTCQRNGEFENCVEFNLADRNKSGYARGFVNGSSRNHKAATVVRYVDKLERRYGKKFSKLFKSITVDNGSEFSDFEGLEKSIYGGKRTSVYYCHPYTSCERGSNERLNREIRRLLPKGTDLTPISHKRIKAVETWVNSYPREIFDYATSAELFQTQLAAI